jgi:hypothetical protein
MKKSILKNLVILSFAFGALFMIGNNVFAQDNELKHADDGQGGGGGITCHEYVERDRANVCYKLLTMGVYRWCDFTGYMANKCTL